MKIHFLMRPSNHYTNLFVPELCTIINKMGHHVSIGIDLLWKQDIFGVDVIHIHWPEYLISKDARMTEVNRFEKRLSEIRQAGIPVVLQCHNLRPHNKYDQVGEYTYQVVCKYATGFVHMGKCSFDVFQKEYPSACHIIIPHHIYDITHHFNYDKVECQRDLGLPPDKIYILSFGKFRNDEERDIIIKCMDCFPVSRYEFITPGFFREHLVGWNVIASIKNIFKYLNYKHKGIRFTSHLIDEDLMERYFTAADIVLIQRTNALNSGNLPMAFACGKVAVGPNIGNVGELLYETGNPVFNPTDIDSIVQAINRGIDLMKDGVGARNKEFAIANWSTSITVKKLLMFYTELQHENI